MSKLLQTNYARIAASQVVPGFVNCYLGNAVTNPNPGVTRSCICEFGLRLNKEIDNIDACTLDEDASSQAS